MLWINYLDTGSEREDTSLEGSLRMEGWRGGAEEEEECGRLVSTTLSQTSVSFRAETENLNQWCRGQSVRSGGRRVLKRK